MKKHYNPDDKENKRKKVLIIVIIAIAIIAGAFFLLRGCNDNPITNEPEATVDYLEDNGGSIDGEAQAKSREDLLKDLEKQQLIITDKLSSNITFESGEVGVIGEWIVENLKENNIIQQAEVYLNDVLIAKSTPIYPNQHITGVELLSSIDAGEYEVTAYLNYYDIETKEFISKAGYAVHLTVR